MTNALSDSGNHTFLTDLLNFVHNQRDAGNQRLMEVWQRPLAEKLERGWTQGFSHLEKSDEPRTLWVYLVDGESRFREGDMFFLRSGSPLEQALCRQPPQALQAMTRTGRKLILVASQHLPDNMAQIFQNQLQV